MHKNILNGGKNMKEIYNAPNLQLVMLNNEDVIMTSVAQPEALVAEGTTLGSVEANLIFE